MASTNHGFELRRLSELSAVDLPAEYSLMVEQQDDGSVAVRIITMADGLLSTELELSYPAQRYSPLEGAYGEWPAEAGEIDQSADFGAAGVISYQAQALNTTGGGGRFGLLQLKFMELAPAPVDPQVAHAAGTGSLSSDVSVDT